MRIKTLEELREALEGYNLAALARMAGVSRQAVSRAVNTGIGGESTKRVIAEAIGIPVEAIDPFFDPRARARKGEAR